MRELGGRQQISEYVMRQSSEKKFLETYHEDINNSSYGNDENSCFTPEMEITNTLK